jgi:mono/diheme cytochrome c family protein
MSATTRRRGLAPFVGVLLLAALAGGSVGLWLIRPRLPAAERGRRLAERTGCFACHGAEGLRGTANVGRNDRKVPTWEGDLMMYAKSPEEIREWIRDGVTRKRAESRTWREQRERGALRMPAFKGRLSERQIDDLVALVSATAGDAEPADSAAARGYARAGALGCVGCHGPGGRFARPNPGSLKGYVPSWDGADFPELVTGRAEFGEWVERGVSRRFARNPLASFFLRRAALHMPAYRDHLEPGDVDALWAYIEWLRTPGAPVRPASED